MVFMYGLKPVPFKLIHYLSRLSRGAESIGFARLDRRSRRRDRTGRATTQSAGDPLALGDGVDAVHGRQLYRLFGAGGPVNLGGPGIGRIAQPEVRPPVVR